MSSVVENLDLVCAEKGKRISSKKLENLITSALAVLEEQGLYAFFLYLDMSREGGGMRDSLREFLKTTPKSSPLLSNNERDIYSNLCELGKNLDDLLLARDLIRQILVYARYHAKAAQE